MSSDNSSGTKHVLVAVLDWGLGHATRSIPIINSLIRRECQITIASSGDALALLKSEFPLLKSLELPAYNAAYSSSIPLIMKLILQIPKFSGVMKKEHKALIEILKQHSIDLIISDNRYGCWAKGVKSILITHQAHILMPGWLKWTAPVIEYYNQKQIRRFDECWLPDEASNLTGKLTAPPPQRHKFIGNLSRFRLSKNAGASDYALVVIISGPEPQRTLFEMRITSELSGLNVKALVVRGRVGETEKPLPELGKISFVNHLDSRSLNKLIEEANIVVCRSGYSSIMDLVALKKKHILFVPTPGQTEQEYLAKVLHEKNIAFFQTQSGLDLKSALIEIKKYSGFEAWTHESNLLENALDEVLR